MKHDVNFVLHVVGVGVDGVTAPLLSRVACGGGMQLLLWGVSRSMSSPLVNFLPPEFFACIKPFPQPRDAARWEGVLTLDEKS
jgi:hypothetical protein